MSTGTMTPAPAPERPADAEIEVVQQTKRVSVARARLDALFDPGSFDEIGDRVLHRCDRFGLEKRRTPGDGVVTGVGTVDGRTVYAFAQDKTVLGGSLLAGLTATTFGVDEASCVDANGTCSADGFDTLS